MRVFYLILANLALPFLLFYLRNAIYKVYYVIILKNKKKQVPKLNFKLAIKLLACGFVLLGSILAYYRLQVEQQDRGDFNHVKQYDFR